MSAASIRVDPCRSSCLRAFVVCPVSGAASTRRMTKSRYDSPMLPLAQAPVYIREVLPFYTLDGMTLLLGAFFFYSLAHPHRVRNRTQFWAVFVVLLLIVLLYALRLMLYNSPAGQVMTGVFIGLLQAGGLVLTVLYVGGLQFGDVAEELKDAADEFRRGGEPAKPPIVPLTGEKPMPRHEPVPAAEPVSPMPPRVVIDLPKKDDGPLPLG